MRKIRNAIRKLGLDVMAESSEGLKRGRAVICPMRSYQRQWGGSEQTAQGRTEPKRFSMFCERELLDASDYGSIIYQGRDRYVLIWKDDYSSKVGCFTKACLRKLTGEGNEYE